MMMYCRSITFLRTGLYGKKGTLMKSAIKKICVVAVAAATIMLSACGGSGAAKGVTDTKADKGLKVLGDHVTYDPNHLVNDGKPIEIQYYTWYPDSDGTITALKEYEKIYPNVSFKIVNVGWEDYFTKLPMLLKGKNGPAIFGIHNSYDEVLRPYLAPYDIPVSDLEQDYIGVKAHEVDGKVSYIDSAINTGNIYYNKDMWKKAGLTEKDIPKTWEQFRQVAIKLTSRDGDKFTQCGFNLNGDAGYSSFFEGLNYQNGELLFQGDRKTVNYDNSVTKKNLQWMHDLYNKDKVCSTNFGTDGDKSFGNGQTAMLYRWGYFEGDLQTKYKNVSYGMFPTPTPTEDTPFAYDRYNGESTIGINKNASSDQQEVAQDVVKFLLAGDTYVKSVSKFMNSFPAKLSLSDDSDLAKMQIFDLIKPRVERLIWPGAMPATIESTSITVFQNIFNNGQSIDSAVAAGQKKMQNDVQKLTFESAEEQYKYFSEK
jgi:multiple sugar transport system substrate-binding protein